MNVLSLFDGMSCGQIALNRLGIKYDNYFASEIKKHAIKVTQHNYPGTIQIGDVTKVSYSNGILKTSNGEFKVDKFDLILAGSPCQDFSNLNCKHNIEDFKEYGLEGEKSKLFFEFVRLLKETQGTYFLLENVRMKKESEYIINRILGVDSINIDSNLVSAQNRNRLYWTNVPCFDLPEDKKIYLKDILETNYEKIKNYKVNKTPWMIKAWGDGINGVTKNISTSMKSCCMTTQKNSMHGVGLIEFEDFCRYVTPEECERLQTVPENYTSILSENQRYNVLGDGWTIDVICHILKELKDPSCKPIIKDQCSLEDFFK
jgi:site-specific DNA-cytosine methylase